MTNLEEQAKLNTFPLQDLPSTNNKNELDALSAKMDKVKEGSDKWNELQKEIIELAEDSAPNCNG